jgi:hypothetical protein
MIIKINQHKIEKICLNQPNNKIMIMPITIEFIVIHIQLILKLINK